MKKGTSNKLVHLTITGLAVLITGSNYTLLKPNRVDADNINYSGYSVPLSQAKKTTPMLGSSFSNKDITYYIKSSSNHYRTMWKKATKAWNKGKYVKLIAVKNPHKAQMLLTTKADSPDGKSKFVGLTWPVNQGKTLVYTESQVYRNVFKNYGYNDNYQVHVAEHEIGHALGLGVSPYKGSIEYLYTVDQHISTPDWNAISKLYKNKPAKVNVPGGFYNDNVSDSQFKY